jgi:hypothetical protein
MERRMNQAARFAAGLLLFFLLVFLSGCEDLSLIAIIRELKNPSVPQFTSTLGPPGATVRALVVSGTAVYAGCIGGGVYKSTNTGLTWSAVGAFLPHDVRALTTDGTYLYAGTGDGLDSPYDGTYRIKLSGGSWENFGLTEAVWALLVSGGYVYAGIDGTVMRIPTGGGSWTDTDSGAAIGTGRVYCLIEGPSGDPWAGSSDGAFRYQGGTWTEMGAANRAWSMAYNGADVFITSDDVGVQYWTGIAWATYGTGLTSTRNPSVTATGGYVYMGDNGGGVYRCNGVGNTWAQVGSASDEIDPADVFALAVVGTTMLAGTHVGPGIYTHGTLSATGAWSKAGSGIYSSTVYDLITDGTNLFAGTDRGVFARPLSGGFWNDFGTSGPADTVYDLEIEGGYLFAGGSSQVNRVALSGGSWSAFGTGLGTATIRALHSDGTNLYSGTWTGDVYRVLLTGGTWSSWGPELESGNGANQFFEANATLFKASNQGVKSKALAGASWSLLGTATNGFYSFASDGTYLYAGTNASGVKRILLSGGSDWEDFGSGLPAFSIWALQIVGDELVAGVEATGVYSMPLSGGFWQPFGTGLFAGSTIGAFLLNGQTLYIGTGEFAQGGSGVWQANVGTP